MDLVAAAQMVVSACRDGSMPMPEMIWVTWWPGGERTAVTGVISLTSPWVIIRFLSRIDWGTPLERRSVVSRDGVRATKKNRC